MRAVWNDIGCAGGTCGSHSKRLEDPSFQKIAPGLTADASDDFCENVIPEVGILVLVAGFSIERNCVRGLDHVDVRLDLVGIEAGSFPCHT
jgi:hypothetical protein